MKTTKTALQIFTGLILALSLWGGPALADPPFPVVQSADAEGTGLFIVGANFGAAKPPKVVLGGNALAVSSYAPTDIVATLPSSLPPATYLLVVTTFRHAADPNGFTAEFNVTVGANGPAGAKGETGSQGTQGVAGPPGPKGDTGAQGIQGPPGATGAKGDIGAQGIQGPPGAPGLKGDTGLQGAQGIQGVQGIPGVPGPAGPPGSGTGTTLASLDSLIGLPCNVGTQFAGTVRISYDLPSAGNGIRYTCAPSSFLVTLRVVKAWRTFSVSCGSFGQTCDSGIAAEGHVTLAAGGVACTSNCVYPSGTVVTLTATPLATVGYGGGAMSTFGWNGACSGTSTTCTLTITSDVEVIGMFNLP